MLHPIQAPPDIVRIDYLKKIAQALGESNPVKSHPCSGTGYPARHIRGPLSFPLPIMPEGGMSRVFPYPAIPYTRLSIKNNPRFPFH
jgi:hypothetical protein